ncbi:MAG: hypothetical protein GY796_02015 [Chloroflexi bacterium]|nr:hypothetical protein [Chloroflexota bacterium]
MFSKWTWLALLLAVLFPAAHLTGAQTPVEISKNEAWVDFPESVDFRLAATAVSPIESVQLEYGLEMLSCGEVTAVVSPELSPDKEVDLTWRWDLLSETFIPPGSAIWWRWHIQTAAGDILTTERETAVFLDSWFVWQTISQDNVFVHWYRGPNSLGQQMLTAAVESIDQLAAETGLRLTDPVHLYLYDESFDLQASLPGAPAWAGGAAFPEQNVVLITANMDYLDYAEDTTRHEIGHLVIGRLTFNCTNRLPTWLNEGLAMVAEGHEDENAAARLTEAIDNNAILTIPQLEGSFSIHGDRARLSYAQSYSLVRYLLDDFSQAEMLTLLETFTAGATPDEALQTTYGLDTNELEDVWRASIGAEPRSFTAPATTPTAVPTLALAAPTTQTTIVAQLTKTMPPATAEATATTTATAVATQISAVQPTKTPLPLTNPTTNSASGSSLFPFILMGTVMLGMAVVAILLLIKHE